VKILLVAHKVPPYALGGVEVYTWHLARTLADRHQVAIFFRHDDVDGPPFAEHDQEVAGVRLRRVSHSPSGLGASVAGQFWSTFRNHGIEASFARFLEAFRPEVIHIQHVMGLSARLLPLARVSGVPVLLTLHDYWFLCGNSQLIWPDGQVCRGKACGANCVRCAAAARFPSPLVRWLRPGLAPLFLYRDQVVKQAARAADRLIAPSHFLIERYTAAGYPGSRFAYLENGIPVNEIRRFPRLAGGGALRVTFLGSLAWQKGVHVLAEAWKGLPPDVARLRIWGDPLQFPEYSNRLRGSLAGTGAELMGRIANERVGEILADSDVVVVPSLWFENSPVVIQEARAAGLPVVASAQGALAEKVHDGIDGLLFPPGDAGALRQALQRLITEPELLPRLRRGVQPALDIGAHVRELERIYEQADHPDTLL
jgi:glycosyltransferase involved in cell wall biosynthesis